MAVPINASIPELMVTLARQVPALVNAKGEPQIYFERAPSYVSRGPAIAATYSYDGGDELQVFQRRGQIVQAIGIQIWGHSAEQEQQLRLADEALLPVLVAEPRVVNISMPTSAYREDLGGLFSYGRDLGIRVVL